MILKTLHIISFGGIRNRDINLEEGVNVIAGENESGKSSAAMFIKFIFYGLSGKSSRGIPSERKRYINRETGQAAGYITVVCKNGREFRLERAILTSDNMPPRERVRIIDIKSGETVTGQNPGEFFFGVPEGVFVDTCFISQTSVIKPNMNSTSSSGGALENLLTSANENIDIKKAIKKLDETRRGLFHKYKTGGEIKDLIEKRAEIASELKAAREKSAEIIGITTSLDDIKKRIASLEESKEKYDGIFDALEKIVVKRKIDSLSESREHTKNLEKSLNSLNLSPLGDGFEETLDESERDIRAYDEKCAEYDEMLSESEKNEDEPPEIMTSIEEIAAAVHQVDSASRIQFSVAIALLIAGVIGLTAVILLFYFNTDMYILPLIMTVALVSLGIIFIVRHAKSNSKLEYLLSEWDAESPEEIEIAVAEKLSAIGREQTSKEKLEALTPSLENAKIRFDAACERITSLAKEADIAISDDIYETLYSLRGIAEKINSERHRMISKLENLQGRIGLLTEQLDGVDIHQAELEAYTAAETPYGKIAAELDANAIKTTSKERDFTENALRASTKKKSDLEEKLVEIGKLSADPDELATKLAALDELIEELTLRHDACELAVKTITEAGECMRSEVIPQISHRASEIIVVSTQGLHKKLTLDSAFNAGLTAGEDVITSEFLSRGTSDLSYIALRIAIAEEVFKAEAPIMVFDESFAHIDSVRTEASFRLLGENQYIILTCRRDDTAAAEKIGANIIKL